MNISIKKPSDIFPGYIMILVTAIVTYWGAGIYMYSLGSYVNVLTRAFGWTRAEISFAASLNGIAGGLQGAFAGIAIDRFGPRIISFIGLSMLGLGFCMIYFVDSLGTFYIFWLIAGFGYGMGMMPSLHTALANWFVNRRGFMISLANLGLCLSGITMTPLIMWLLRKYGWQNTFLFTGMVTLVITLPLIWFFIKSRRPEYYGWMPDGKRVDVAVANDTELTIKAGLEYASASDEIEFTVRQALKNKTIWLFCITSALSMMAVPALTAHSVPYFTDMGIDPIVAATIMGMSVFMRFPTQLLFGWLADRVSKDRLRYLGMIGLALCALGLFIFTRATSIGWAWAYAVVFGLGTGVHLGIQAQIRGKYWGRKAFATIGGVVTPFMLISGIVSPVYAGWVYDTTGSYGTAFNMILIMSVLAVIVMYFVTPPKPPTKITKISEFL